MNNTFYFLRHGETKIDRNMLISKWKLSEKGEEQARKLKSAPESKRIKYLGSKTKCNTQVESRVRKGVL